MPENFPGWKFCVGYILSFSSKKLQLFWNFCSPFLSDHENGMKFRSKSNQFKANLTQSNRKPIDLILLHRTIEAIFVPLRWQN